jgi:hypothetical protein
MMRAILVSIDLIVVSRVEGAAAKVGGTVQVTSNISAAAECMSGEGAEIVIVDLGSSIEDIKAQVTTLKSATSPSPRVVAFGPHVHENRLAAAREAGCDVVMSRGQFFSQIDSLLRS